ncbi:hypothetical protein Skr01_46530 [Sphaerisporangium krabiense]|uniref:WD40 repeat domain-containing protein n=1 Tax=Sphaerisporangium krabiense TaxID=763782 RepID=A0A7W8Z4G8_9ACTN|nr:hypothetical protein [Sphaerisporangium krabiense]MBB5627297.1 hypothetical protein [Sphaerisporangium krabiense]GII64568.1 hypothetical protein Skr01_46530 [Sphaerisporangium krabiense]
MTPESLLPDTLREWAGEAQVPHDLADRVLRRRGRRRLTTVVLATGATAAVVAAGVLAPVIVRGAGGREDRTATAVTPTASASVSPTAVSLATPPPDPLPEGPPPRPSPVEAGALPASLDVRADPGQAPPRGLIAAGRMAVSSYFVSGYEKTGARSDRRHDTWYLYDPRTDGYERTDWSTVDVAPGMRLAAVLERDLPASRVGILDMATRQVRWVPLDHPVARVAWSPDGTKVLATAYEKNPDVREKVSADGTSWEESDPVRTGFHIVEASSGTAAFHAVDKPSEALPGPPDAAFQWSSDGTLISEPNDRRFREEDPQRLYYGLDGRRAGTPATEELDIEQAGTSPDGRLYAGRRVYPRGPKTMTPEKAEEFVAQRVDGPETVVRDTATGKIVGRQWMLQLLAWADNDHLIALQCLGGCENEFDSYLALVTVDGRQSVRLSGDMKDSQRPGSWHPVLTSR